MYKNLFIVLIASFLLSRNSNPEKEKATKLLKERIGNQLPFKEVKTVSVENGTAVIVDGDWCYWIASNDKIYCVNGSAKSIYRESNPPCEDAPIQATFADIQKIAQ